MSHTMSGRVGMMEGYGGPVRIDEADYSGIDPTLDACCRREAESKSRADQLNAAIRRHDRVAATERMRRHIVSVPGFASLGVAGGLSKGCRCCYDPDQDGGEYGSLRELRSRLAEEVAENRAEDKENLEVAGKAEDELTNGKAEEDDGDCDSDDCDSDDSEFDYLLDEDIPGSESTLLKEMEERRRAELQATALISQAALWHGYGTHRQMHPSRALRSTGLGMSDDRAGIPPAAVLHLYDPNSDLSASLDVFLEKMAVKWKGTKFVRSGGRAALLMDTELAGSVLPRIRPDFDLPTLIAIKDGAVKNFLPHLSGLGCESDGTVDARAVEDWLGMSGVLFENPPELEAMCKIRPEEDALFDFEMRHGGSGGASVGAAELAKHFLSSGQQRREEVYNCGMPGCGKTFAHEHVGVKNEAQDGLVVCEGEVVGPTGNVDSMPK